MALAKRRLNRQLRRSAKRSRRNNPRRRRGLASLPNFSGGTPRPEPRTPQTKTATQKPVAEKVTQTPVQEQTQQPFVSSPDVGGNPFLIGMIQSYQMDKRNKEAYRQHLVNAFQQSRGRPRALNDALKSFRNVPVSDSERQTQMEINELISRMPQEQRQMLMKEAEEQIDRYIPGYTEERLRRQSRMQNPFMRSPQESADRFIDNLDLPPEMHRTMRRAFQINLREAQAEQRRNRFRRNAPDQQQIPINEINEQARLESLRRAIEEFNRRRNVAGGGEGTAYGPPIRSASETGVPQMPIYNRPNVDPRPTPVRQGPVMDTFGQTPSQMPEGQTGNRRITEPRPEMVNPSLAGPRRVSDPRPEFFDRLRSGQSNVKTPNTRQMLSLAKRRNNRYSPF